MPQLFDDVSECVESALVRVGKRVVLALPLGIGKPNTLANEFFRRAVHDPTIDLTIITALSLRVPSGSSDLERRFVEPLVARVFGEYPQLEYLRAMRADRMPANIRVIEFFLEPGAWLGNTHAQQNYLAANYTHVARELVARGVNVIAHLVAKRSTGSDAELSLGSNPDVTLDVLPLVGDLRAAGQTVLLLGQVHPEMPFMLGHARLAREQFDLLLEHARYDYPLFAPPNPALSSIDHAIGMHASALVRDGGTLQIGIGELGDAVVYALLLRHQQNEAYRQALRDFGAASSASLIEHEGGQAPLTAGLFGSTEMFVDQMLDLYRAGILRRRVYDYLPLQRALASGAVQTRFDESILTVLCEHGAGPVLTLADFEALRAAGVLRSDTRFEHDKIIAPSGQQIGSDLADLQTRKALALECLGRELQGGAVLHAGFLLGPRAFYAALRDLPESERSLFDMRGVGYINQLYGEDSALRIAQRSHARFINTTMMVTMLGAAVSDGLDDGRVVSGVGGQYNFVAMAHALPNARSILCVRATRYKDGQISSNIVASYGHATIPRHLRDIVITEYGSADLRGRTDAECVAAMLAICDSRFQDELLAKAKQASKIASSYVIPPSQRNNLPAQLEQAFAPHRRAGRFSQYPFGTDLTQQEIELAAALQWLKVNSNGVVAKATLLARAWLTRGHQDCRAHLRRLELHAPATPQARIAAKLVQYGLAKTRGTATV